MTSYRYRHTQSVRGSWPFQNLPQWHPLHHKFTCNRWFKSIPFLDVNVFIINGNKNHHWPSHKTDSQTLTPLTLFMPPFTHQTCNFFQFTSQTAPNLLNGRFTFRINEPMAYLHKCGYHRHFLRQEITRAKNITRKVARLPKNATTSTMDKSKCIPFLLTHNRRLSATSHPSFANASAFGPHPVFATT